MAKAVSLTGIAIFFCAIAAGNSRQLVRGHGNQNPYQVIYTSKSSDTHEKPGIYGFAQNGSPKLLFPGAVLGASATFSGILANLELAQISDRNEVIAVVDGQLLLLSTKSKPSDNGTFFALGKGTDRVFDILTRQHVTIPKIQSLADISLFTSRRQGSGVGNAELVLISIRNSNPLGTGLTIGMVVDSSDSAALTVHGDPVVLDYTFLTKKELAGLDVPGGEPFRVVSQLVMKQQASPRNGDFALVERWRRDVTRFARIATSGKRDASTNLEFAALRPHMPIYSLVDNSVELELSPSDLVLEEPMAIRQFFNPLDGAAVISSGDKAIDEERVGLQGTLDFDADGTLIAVPYTDPEVEENSAVLVARSGKMWAALPMGGSLDKTELVDIGLDYNSNSRLSFVHVYSGPGQHFLLTSSRDTRSSLGALTQCTVIDELGGKLVVTKRFPLVSKFIPQKELRARLIVKEEDSSHTELLLFDDVTPVTAGKRYDPKRERTTPYISLKMSDDKKQEQVYIKSIDEKQISEDIAFREFDPKGSKKPHTGIYVNLGNRAEAFVPGHLLKKQKKRILLDAEQIEPTTADPAATIRLVAVSSDPNGRTEKEFHIIGIAKAQSENFVGSLFEIPIPASFENFRGAKIVLGRRKNSLEMSVLTFLDPAKKGSGRSVDRNGGVYSQHFKLEYAYQSQPRRLIVHPVNEGCWLERDSVLINSMKDRLIPDPNGNWFWITNPAIDKKSAQFAVRALSNPDVKIFPRRAGTQKLLRWEETLDTDWGKQLGGSDWVIYGEYSLGNLHPNISKILKDRDVKGETDSASTFPGLDEFLDSAAAIDGYKGPTVLLVDARVKERVIEQILLRLATNKTGPWAFSNRRYDHFNFHEVLEADLSRERLADEIQKIMGDNTPRRRGLLFSDILKLLPKDAKQVLAVKRRNALKETKLGGSLEQSDQENAEDDANESDETEADSSESAVAKDSRSGKKRGKESGDDKGDSDDEAEMSGDSEESGESAEPKKVHGSPFLLLLTGGQDIGPARLDKPGALNSFPSIVIATPDEWRTAREFFPNEQPVFDRFKVASEVLSSSWTLWSPDSDFATKSTKALNRAPSSREEHEVFPNLEKILMEMTDKTQPARHRILLVPDEIKSLVERLVLTRWASDSSAFSGPWNHTNPDLPLFQLSRTIPGAKEGEFREVKQDDIFDNFDSMRAIASTSSRRPVLIGRMDEVARLGRPTAIDADTSFAIRDHAQRGQSGTMDSGAVAPSASSSERIRIPHALWWLMAEGQRVQPKKLERAPLPPTLNSLLIGSERDWAILQSETEWESRFGLAKSFEVIRLEAPSTEKRQELIQNLFNREEIRRLGYRCQLDAIEGAEAQRQIVSLVVNRAGQIARQHQLDDTAAFIRVYAELSRALTQDSRLRSEKLIDRFFVESLFSRIFPVPIALNSLPPDDFLHRLKNPVQAGVAIQALGYNSAIDLKTRVINTILGQTHGSTPGRPIPSSTILFGGTSTGKTFLFEIMVKYLGLKAYDPDIADNEDADYYIVKMRNLREKEDPTIPESRGVDAEIENIISFLAGPKGHRAFILFDDIHLAKSTDIYRKMMAFIESLFEAKDGYITVKRKGQDLRREIPVRNLNLFLTINPKRDKEIRDRYDAEGNLTGEILAALARPDYSVEDSFLARFTTIIDMSEFPSEAKAPALVNQLRKAMEDDYRADARLVVVAPDLLASVVSGNQDANAREFLTSATRSLIHLDGDIPETPIYVATATSEGAVDGGHFDTRTEKVEAYVKAHRVLKPVGPKDFANQIEWMRLNLDSFRLHAAHAALQGARRDPKLAGDAALRRSLLVPLFLASMQYFQGRTRLPVSLVQIHPEDFGGLDSGERDFILRLIDQHSKEDAGFFPFAFGPRHGANLPRMSDFLRGTAAVSRQHNRKDVLSDTSKHIYDALAPLFQSFYRVDSIGNLPEPSQWFRNLPKVDPKSTIVSVGDQLSGIFQRLGGHLFDSNLAEVLEDRPSLTSFDQAVFFLMALDRAVLDFPWARLNHYLTVRVTEAAADPSIGQTEEFQAFLFKNKLSPFNPMTVDSIVQTFDTLNEKREVPSGGSGSFDLGKRCSELIAGVTVTSEVSK